MTGYGQKVKSIIGDSFLKWEDGKEHPLPQDYADMTGWRELADIVDRAYLSLSEDERKSCVIFCENYGQAGAVLHYAQQNIPPPISFSDNFLQWAPDSLNISTFIYINDETDDIKKLFEEVVEFDRLKNSARARSLKRLAAPGSSQLLPAQLPPASRARRSQLTNVKS